MLRDSFKQNCIALIAARNKQHTINALCVQLKMCAELQRPHEAAARATAIARARPIC